ncbi:MAG: protoporphyrinogen oxidase HemJ [Rhodospirillaceae bacterium]
MIEISADVYLWIKAVHVIAVIAWMAGMLYLPRLFVYHAEAEPGSDKSETFKVMERRLLRAIMNPAMMVAVTLGLVMMVAQGAALWQTGWFPVKAACVGGLMALHVQMGKWWRNFAEDRNTRSAKFFRIMNEVPTVFMIAAVIMVVVRPF